MILTIFGQDFQVPDEYVLLRGGRRGLKRVADSGIHTTWAAQLVAKFEKTRDPAPWAVAAPPASLAADEFLAMPPPRPRKVKTQKEPMFKLGGGGGAARSVAFKDSVSVRGSDGHAHIMSGIGFKRTHQNTPGHRTSSGSGSGSGSGLSGRPTTLTAAFANMTIEEGKGDGANKRRRTE